eukprot:scaffold74609_cov118-Phaeocystis_antarctica.AAC.1
MGKPGPAQYRPSRYARATRGCTTPAPHAPPSGRLTCHAWPERRTLRGLPGRMSCATRGCTPHAPPSGRL